MDVDDGIAWPLQGATKGCGAFDTELFRFLRIPHRRDLQSGSNLRRWSSLPDSYRRMRTSFLSSVLRGIMRATRSTAAKESETTTPIPSTFRDSLRRFQYSGEGSVSTTPNKVSPVPRSQQLSPLKRKPEVESLLSSPAPKKRKRESSSYAHPSKYAHLPPLQDVLEDNLIAIFVGFNPGVRTAQAGHAYAHPSVL